MSRLPSLVFAVIGSLAVLLTLAACGGPTPYQPSDGYEGFSEQRIEADRFRVQVAGNSLTPRQTVQDQLLYRAAQLTVQHGYRQFAIVARGVEPKTEYYSYPAEPLPPWYWRHGWGAFPPRYETDQVTRYDAWAEIKMYKQAAPAGANAYEAREVMDRLGPRVLTPKPG